MKLFQSAMTVLAAVDLSAVSAQASAQVIQVDDNGETQTFSGPTRFVSGPVEPAPAPLSKVPDRLDSFDRAAQSEKVDVQLLRAVAWTESRGHANAISSKGALGVMQLMPGTAAELGVDALDADANIRGGARYLARQLDRFRSVPLALAAYNAGPGAVQRWGGIPPYAETQAYVTSIMSRWSKRPPTAENPAAPTIPVTKPRAPKRHDDFLLIEVPQ